SPLASRSSHSMLDGITISRHSCSSRESCDVYREGVEGDLIESTTGRCSRSREHGCDFSGSEALLGKIKTDLLRGPRHIQDNQHRLILVTAQVGEDVGIVLIQRDIVSVEQRAVLVPKSEQVFIKLQNRVRVFQFAGHI